MIDKHIKAYPKAKILVRYHWLSHVLLFWSKVFSKSNIEAFLYSLVHHKKWLTCGKCNFSLSTALFSPVHYFLTVQIEIRLVLMEKWDYSKPRVLLQCVPFGGEFFWSFSAGFCSMFGGVSLSVRVCVTLCLIKASAGAAPIHFTGHRAATHHNLCTHTWIYSTYAHAHCSHTTHAHYSLKHFETPSSTTRIIHVHSSLTRTRTLI